MMTCAWSFSSIEFKDPLFFVIICIGLMQYVPVSIPIIISEKIGTIHLRYKSYNWSGFCNMLKLFFYNNRIT